MSFYDIMKMKIKQLGGEDMENKKLKLDENYFSVCANALIKANQRMTLREMQLIQIAIAQICKEDTELFTYTTTAVELARFLGVSRQSIYKDYSEITRNLLKNVITIETDDYVKSFQWLSYAEYNKKNHIITIRLHDELKPFLIGLSKLYTQIDLNTIIKFKTYYALRLYQLLLSEYGQSKKTKFELTVEEIRNFYGIKDGMYTRPYDLIKKTVNSAVTELNGTDLCTIKDYKIIHSIGKGNPLTAVSFSVKWN